MKSKHILMGITALSVVLGSLAAAGPDVSGADAGESAQAPMSLNRYLSPVWTRNTVYDESVMVLSDPDGKVSPISLLYEIREVLSVKSGDLRTEYVQNKDYKVENGKLVILPGSDIWVMDYADYYLSNSVSGQSFPCTKGGHIRFSEGSYFHSRQIAVTYTHADAWEEAVPERQLPALARTSEKLVEGLPLNIVFYGDSITVGANSSGFVNVPPFLPIYANLTVTGLETRYDHNEITVLNRAVGGKDSAWGVTNAQAEVADKNPDLVVIAFGMNDGSRPVPGFKNNIKAIIDAVRAENEECEFVLVATMLPNQEVSGFFGNQIHFAPALWELAEEYGGVAVADVTSVHTSLLKRKRYYDMTGNNVNHPNDFLARIYAQVMLETLSDPAPTVAVTPEFSGGSVSLNGEALISGAAAQVKAAGGETLAFSPLPGYSLKSASLGGADIMGDVINGSYTTPALAADCVLSVVFERESILVTPEFSGGTVSLNGSALTSGAAVELKLSGGDILAFSPPSGYRLKSVTLGGADITGEIANGSYTTSALADDCVLDVQYEKYGTSFTENPSTGSKILAVGLLFFAAACGAANGLRKKRLEPKPE